MGINVAREGNGGIIDDYRLLSLGSREVLLTVMKGKEASEKGNKQSSFLGWLFDAGGEIFTKSRLEGGCVQEIQGRGDCYPPGVTPLTPQMKKCLKGQI